MPAARTVVVVVVTLVVMSVVELKLTSRPCSEMVASTLLQCSSRLSRKALLVILRYAHGGRACKPSAFGLQY